MNHQCRGGRVANSHLAERDDVCAGLDLTDGDSEAARQRIGRVLCRHRWLARGIRRTHAHLGVDQFRVHWQFGGDADVDHAHTDVIGRGESIGRGAAGQIGHHHRNRDRRRILRHAFGHETVISRKYQ